MFGCRSGHFLATDEGKTLDLTNARRISGDVKPLDVAGAGRISREELARPDAAPPSVSPSRIDLGGALPPDGASVLEHISREIENQEQPAGGGEGGASGPAKEKTEGSGKGDTAAKEKAGRDESAATTASSSPAVELPPDEPTALRWLGSPIERHKAAACRFFAGYPTERAVKPLARVALSGTPSSRFAMEALAAVGGREAAASLAKAARLSPVPANRWYAALQLCYGMAAEADVFIPSLISVPDYKVGLTAVQASAARRLAGAEKVLRKVQDDGALPERLRLEAAGAILSIVPRDNAAKAFLGGALDRGGVSALMALEVLSATPGDWPALVLAGALLSRDQRAAYAALAGLVLRHPEQSMRALEQAFGPPLDRHERVRMAAGILKAARDPSEIARMLESPRVEERYLACRVARFLRLRQVEEKIGELAKTDGNPSVRAAAAQALSSLRVPETPAPAWAPRAVTAVYLSAGRELEGAFILDMKGGEAFFHVGDILPNGSVLEGFSDGALTLRTRSETVERLQVPEELLRVRTAR